MHIAFSHILKQQSVRVVQMAGLLISKLADKVLEVVLEVVKKASTKAGEQVAVKEVDKHYSKESAGVPQKQSPPKSHFPYGAAISGFFVTILVAAILRRVRTANVPEVHALLCTHVSDCVVTVRAQAQLCFALR